MLIPLPIIPEPAHSMVSELIAGITAINSDFILGMYLTGSIPLNDFHPDKSDVDFLILCQNLPDPQFQIQLEKIHRAIQQKFTKPDLSGIYLTLKALNLCNARTVQVLSFHEGRMNLANFGMAAVTLFELKTIAQTVMGIPRDHLPIVVDTKTLIHFLHENINTYWKNWIKKHASFGFRQLLLILIPRLSEWVVLGVARQLYTLRTGCITSKTAAGYYCLDQLPVKYHSIIKAALQIRKEHSAGFCKLKPSYWVAPSVKRAAEALACATYILDLFNKEYQTYWR